MYIKPLKIGNVVLENNIVLAPMAGITDLPFRYITKKFNPGLVYTEMVSAKALFFGDEKTKKLLNMKNEKRPIAVQIFGSDVEAMVYATKYLQDKADIIDINMGCPAPKVVKNGDGSKLLLNLDLVGEIVTAVVEASDIPVTVKIRKGWNDENIVAKEVAKIIEKAGASAITIHGRTREEFYSGKADLDIIRKVKESINIPCIGNGDIKSPEDALKMFKETNVDGIMIGRASLGNPWIFKNVIDYLKTGTYDASFPNNDQKLKLIIEHINLEVEEKGEDIGVKEMRKHLSSYIKNLKDASRIREKINTLKTKQEVIDCLEEYFKSI
ncbi:MAG: tRNA dihydrouridine synthase DusB [Clostridia bacterium]|nr:tRNA dihydrouridine synthase DusB [Clostridia bacterium]